MFTKQESAVLRKEFWTAFGHYMKPIPSFDGEKVNWLNYRTGEKGVIFRMEADNKGALISIDIVHPDPELQQLYYNQFLRLRSSFERIAGDNWIWLLHSNNSYGKVTSKIFSKIDEVSILNRTDWPALISFFKPRIIALDEFWSSSRYSFESLH